MANKTKTKTYIVEGPDWKSEVLIDIEDHDDRTLIFEVATRGMEDYYNRMDGDESFNIGPIVIVKEKGKKKAPEKLVNSFICLNNCGMYKLAEDLRSNYKKQTGTDLALDENGIS